MNKARVLVISPLVVAAVAAAGCGSSSSSSTSSAASAPSSTSSSAAASNRYGAASTTGAATTARAVVVTTKHDKLGTLLAAGPKKLTVYLFEADKGPHSSCTGACAAAWPPVVGKATVAGTAKAADLGTITRPDGTTQVTYKGHPLYFFVKDKDDGDAYGQGVKAFGAEWYVMSPSGSKIDKS